ncbi:hypothetical protein Tco_0985361 [Tanacetum coccineum]
MASGGSDQNAEYALSKLLKMGTVAEYKSEFVILANRVTNISANLLKSFYISGLKLELQRELFRSRPTTLGEAFSFARITEARFEDEQSTTAIAKPNELTATFKILSKLLEEEGTSLIVTKQPMARSGENLKMAKPLSFKLCVLDFGTSLL